MTSDGRGSDTEPSVFIRGHPCSSVDSMAARPPRDWGVYLVTDRTQTNGRPLLEVVAAALRGGDRRGAVARARSTDRASCWRSRRRCATLTRAAGAALLINDRLDVALACDADGVHLPGHSFAVAEARALLGAGSPDRPLDPRRRRGRAPPPRPAPTSRSSGRSSTTPSKAAHRRAARTRRTGARPAPPHRCRCSPSAASMPTTPRRCGPTAPTASRSSAPSSPQTTPRLRPPRCTTAIAAAESIGSSAP